MDMPREKNTGHLCSKWTTEKDLQGPTVTCGHGKRTKDRSEKEIKVLNSFQFYCGLIFFCFLKLYASRYTINYEAQDFLKFRNKMIPGSKTE